MARIKRKGEAGAARAYVTRSAAVKKLQCSLADFRRLCILKGIFPREPRNKKKANKGSSAPTTFYYAKDIAYLAHEPVLKKLREHKAFAKKFARALGRGEWSSAKSLEESKPVYRIDHIIKERYPSFIDAVRDVDDALCMVFLFASLPSGSRIPPSLIENCSKLAAEWQLYVIKSKSLRKVFLSIKGIYYQAEVMGERVTWLVPYMFTQTVPSEVDVRVMLTFLDLYQTLLGFVFFRLYLDSGLTYPPMIDVQRDQDGAGLGAFTLKELANANNDASALEPNPVTSAGKKITGRAVREAIKDVENEQPRVEQDSMMEDSEDLPKEDDFVPQISQNTQPASLTTFQTLSSSASQSTSPLFENLTFFLSRETPRVSFEFMVRSFGGKIGWPTSQGSGSPFQEDSNAITHVIIDRPVPVELSETEEQRLRRLGRKFVQPQWIVDCINAGKLLPEDLYAQGKTLPPHLSPFGEGSSTYIPSNLAAQNEALDEDDAATASVAESQASDDEDLEAAVDDPNMLQAAELQAEMAGIDAKTFDQKLQKASQRKARGKTGQPGEPEQDMNKMLMTNKQRKLYDKLKYTEKKREVERSRLEQRRRNLEKSQKRK